MSIFRHPWSIAITALAVGVAIGLGAMFVEFYQPSDSQSYSDGPSWFSYVANQRFTAILSKRDLAASPKWQPSAPLPLRPEEAIVRARQSLSAIGPAVADWSFSELALHEEPPQMFFYTVTFRPNQPPPNTDMVQLLVYFNGNVTVPSPNGRAP